MKLREQHRHIKFLLSDESLQLLPEYQQRIEVSKTFHRCYYPVCLATKNIYLVCGNRIKCMEVPDKVRMYEEIMTNDDNLESNLLTSSLLKMLVQVLLQAELEICYCVDPDPK